MKEGKDSRSATGSGRLLQLLGAGFEEAEHLGDHRVADPDELALRRVEQAQQLGAHLGQRLHLGEVLDPLLVKHATEPPPSLVDTRPDLEIPADLDDLIRKALDKDRDQRFATAGEMLEALESVRYDHFRKPNKRRGKSLWYTGLPAVFLTIITSSGLIQVDAGNVALGGSTGAGSLTTNGGSLNINSKRV